MNDLWCVVIGDPPWHFGPFDSEDAADDYSASQGGTVWPLWTPENEAAQAQRNGITETRVA